MSVQGRIGELRLHPVKGCHGLAVPCARLGPMGLEGDRRWMIVDAVGGRFLTQRELPALARIVPRPEAEGLVLAIDGAAPLRLPPDGQGEPVVVRVWRDELTAVAPSPQADAALSRALGRGVRLVRFPETARRPCDPAYAGPDDHTGFADGFPVLVTTDGSLRELDEALAEAGREPVPMRRFRPNLVVHGVPPRTEDRHGRLELAGATLELVKPCDRCIVTTTDQETGERLGDEPLRTLRRIRRNPRTGGVWFGQNAVVRLAGDAPVRLQVGDPVRFTGAPRAGAVAASTHGR